MGRSSQGPRQQQPFLRQVAAALVGFGIGVWLTTRSAAPAVSTTVQASRAHGAAASSAKLPPFPGIDSDPGYCGRLRSVLPRIPEIVEVPTTANYSDEAAAQGVGQLKKMKRRPNLQYMKQPYSLYLYASQDDVVSQVVGSSGSWETNLLSDLHKQLTSFAAAKGLAQEEVYFMDFGGNLGAFTMAIAAAGFRVFSFEALHSNYLGIKLSTCQTPHAEERVTLVNKGIGNEHTTCLLYSPLDNIGNGMVRCGSPPDVPHEKRAYLEVVRLDDLLGPIIPQLKGRVGAIKMDIEGYEPLAVLGGDRFFREVRPPYIVTEVVESFITNSTGKPARHWLMDMADRGYQVFDEGRRELTQEQLGTWTCVQCSVYFKLP